MKKAIIKTYSAKGDKIVNMNCAAVDAGLDAVVKIDVPAAWASLEDQPVAIDPSLPKYIREIQIPVNNQAGDTIPVSAFMDYADGVSPVETSKYERRGIATNVPVWIPENCIGCNMCSLVCPHASMVSVSSPSTFTISVSITPGATQFTRMPVGASSAARERVSPMMACFVHE